MAHTEDANHWKKPKGVFKAINAFDKKYPKVSKGKHSAPRLRKVGHVAKAASILSEVTREKNKNGFEEKRPKVSNQKLSTPRLRKLGHVAKATSILSQTTREKKESNDFQTINEFDSKVSSEKVPTPRLRKLGHVAKATTILSEATREKKERKFNEETTDHRNANSPVSPVPSNGSHRGILKTNKITRTLSNTVKFNQENEINSPPRGPKEAGLGKKLSSPGRGSPSPRTKNKKPKEEGYHSDCLSPGTGNRNNNKAGKKHRIVGRKSSTKKTRKNAKDKEASRDSTESNDESEEREKEEILCLGRENVAIQKNKAQVLWRRLRTVVKLARKMLFDLKPSLVLVSSDNKTCSAWTKMKSAIIATKMANKLLKLRREQRGQIPRGGGRRPQGSFDTLGK